MDDAAAAAAAAAAHMAQRDRGVGIAVDAQGGPVIDPTANVLSLVAAAIQRQDDLRAVESRHVREIAQLRAEYQQELRTAETERINAIRAVDVTAVQQASAVAETRATALATQVAASAEAMRSQVAAAATAAATSLAAALVPIQESIADLRRSQYEAQGSRATVVEGKTAFNATAAIAIGVVGLIISAAIVAVALYAALR